MNRVWLVAFFACTQCGETRAGGAVQVYETYQYRTAHIESHGVLYNKEIEVVAGSGFLLSSKFVVTVNHVIPQEANYQKSEVRVRLGSRNASSLKVAKIHRDHKNDLALLELDAPVSGTRCPFRVATDPPMQIPNGSRLIALGYPIDQELSIIDGTLSNKSAARWQTTLPINPGNSGGPIFDEDLRLLAIARSGSISWIGGRYELARTKKGVPVTGVNFLVPIGTLFQGPLKQVLDSDTQWADCLKVNEDVEIVPITTPTKILRNFSFSETKTDHPSYFEKDTKPFQKDFEAEPGFRISDCRLIELSAAADDDVTCNVIEGGSKARLTGKLTSGPKFDQTRGWWTGEVVLPQVNRDLDELIGKVP